MNRKRNAHARILDVAPLTEADMEFLRQPSTSIDHVTKLRDSHHFVARYLAWGMRYDEIARRTGYSYSRIAILARDPALQELVAKYRIDRDEILDEKFDEFAENAIFNMRAGERMIRDQLEEADETGEPVPLKTLIPLVADRADRFGYGKHNHSTNVNLDFAKALELAIERSKKVTAA